MNTDWLCIFSCVISRESRKRRTSGNRRSPADLIKEEKEPFTTKLTLYTLTSLLQTNTWEVPVMDICHEDTTVLSRGHPPCFPSCQLMVVHRGVVLHSQVSRGLASLLWVQLYSPTTNGASQVPLPDSPSTNLPHQVLSAVSIYLHWALLPMKVNCFHQMDGSHQPYQLIRNFPADLKPSSVYNLIETLY